jgi:hypothetical protein
MPATVFGSDAGESESAFPFFVVSPFGQSAACEKACSHLFPLPVTHCCFPITGCYRLSRSRSPGSSPDNNDDPSFWVLSRRLSPSFASGLPMTGFHILGFYFSFVESFGEKSLLLLNREQFQRMKRNRGPRAQETPRTWKSRPGGKPGRPLGNSASISRG